MSFRSVGQKLQHAREGKALSIAAVAGAIKIKAHYIQWIENGDPHLLPSITQARGFVRALAAHLELNAADLLLEFNAESDNQSPPASKTDTELESTDESTDASHIYASIGARLESQRNRLGLSLEDAAEYTRIPAHYLEYMESGAFENFPSPVQARGMLGNYAAFLEANEAELLLQFAEALQIEHSARAIASPRTKSPGTRQISVRIPDWLARALPLELILSGIATVLLVIVIVTAIGQVLNTQASLQPEPTAPALGQILLPSPTLEFSPTPEFASSPTPDFVAAEPAATDEPDSPLPPSGQGQIQLFLVIRQRTFLRVTVDGVVEFEGRATPGANLAFSGNTQIELVTGSGAAVQAIYNQRDLGNLGIIGEVVTVLFGVDTVVTPTPGITPTSRATPTP